MRWQFRRGDQVITVMVHGVGGHRYVEIRWPNGRQEMRRFGARQSMRLHVLALECQLHNSDFVLEGVAGEDQ